MPGSLPSKHLGLALAALAPWSAGQSAPVDANPATTTFRSLSGTFHIDVPTGWRQLAPGEVAALRRAVPELPRDVGENEPMLFYAVGAVDDWLQGRFDGIYLYVVEQANEWIVDDDDTLAAQLREMWRTKGQRDGATYEIADIARAHVGRENYEAVTSTRTIGGGTAIELRSLDVYVPTGGRELTLCFTCRAAAFAATRQRFETMLGSLSLARKSRGGGTLGDRLWTPLISGAIVGFVLIALHRYTRRRAI